MHTPTKTKYATLEIGLYVAVIIAIVAISFQLFSVTYPPLIDLPNHLARHAIQCGGDLGANYANYYDFQMRAIPNLTADIVYSFEWACQDIFLTNRILIQFMILNFIASVYFLHFVIWKKLSIWPAVSSLLAYNTAFTYGFENFTLAAPFALYLFGGWILLSEKPILLRLAIMVPLALGMYFLHIIAFGFFILLVGGWEIQRFVMQRGKSEVWIPFLIRTSGTVFLGLPALLHFMSMAPVSDEKAMTIFGLGQRMAALISLTMPRNGAALEMGDKIVPLLILQLLVVLVFVGFKWGGMKVDHRIKYALIGVFVIALVVPSTVLNIAFSHVRYPFLVAAVFIASTRWAISLRYQSLLALLIISVFFIRTAEVKREWVNHDIEVRELLDASRIIPDGSWLLMLTSDSSDVVYRHSHSIPYIGLFQPVFSQQLFSRSDPLIPHADVSVFVPAQMHLVPVTDALEYVRAYKESHRDDVTVGQEGTDWPAYFSYFIVLGEASIDAALLGDDISVAHAGSFFTILHSK